VFITGQIVSEKENSIINSAVIYAPGVVDMANNKGFFVLETKQELPFKIKIEAVGYKTQEYLIKEAKVDLLVLLKEEITSLDAIVLSASRTPERVFESSVSIERMGISAIESTTSSTFYDGLENLKGVDVNTSSLSFKTINTRGFARFGNERFVQLVDGMDNTSPGLNFSLGNLIGLNELDVSSVELLPGASSALYGANAFNGILFMKSKSPFVHTGVSLYGKTGVTNSESSGVNEFLDVGVRVAKKVSDAFALKFTASLLKATDWFATDTRNVDANGKIATGDRNTDPEGDYNGINVYGDEFTNPNDLGFGKVSRTGYLEQALLDSDTDNFKASLAFHWRPLKTKDLEVIWASKFGTGNTIYQAASRYALRNFIMHQHKLEIKSKHLVLRSYTTMEDAGDSYNIAFAGINTLRAENTATKNFNTANATSLSVDELWYGTYASALAGGVSGVPGGNVVAARQAADAAFRTAPTSAEFNTIFNKVIKDSDVTTGAKFVDRSKLFHTDVNYNFKELIEFAEVQIGGSARRYVLNSEGTLFTDANSGIAYDEFGLYTQLQKKTLDNRLKLTGSLRYDKSENFDGNFSARASVSFSVDQEKRHNIRASIQTGFRNPTAQDQYIGLDVGNATLIGSAAGNLDRYTRVIDNSSAGALISGSTTHNFIGRQAYENSFTLSSVQEFGSFAASGDFGNAVASLKKAEIDLVKPEHVNSYEIGYRGKLSKKTILDFSTYYNKYKDFISLVTVVAPNYGNVNLLDVTTLNSIPLPNAARALINEDRTVAITYTNTDADIASYGMSVGIETEINTYDFGVSYTFAKQDFNQSQDPDFETNFNTPEHKVKVSFGNANVYKGLGFGVNARWQDQFYWESTFVDAKIDARTIVDAQINYKIEKWNSKIKIGGVNVLKNEYVSAPGSGSVGSQLYGSLTCKF